MHKSTISAIIITKNAARDLQKCLDSLDFCNEWVVVDNGSSDDTVSIAQRFGCRVIITDDWPGFGVQKQRALDAATCDWVLSIDADERISPELAQEIRNAVEESQFDGLYLKRRSQFLGRWMRHGGWYPDWVLRLAKREAARFAHSPVHEKLNVSGKLGRLNNPMHHFSYRSIDDVLRKQHQYALAGALARISRGRSSSVGLSLMRSLWTFFRVYIFQFGFLDGKHGLVAALAKSQETFWKYLSVAWQGDRSTPK